MRLTINVRDATRKTVRERAERVARASWPGKSEGVEFAAEFLRRAAALSVLAAPTFYLFAGAMARLHVQSQEPGSMFQAYALRIAAGESISMWCRQVFDHDTKAMTGKRFANLSDQHTEALAERWTQSGSRSIDEARHAVRFLKHLFSTCARPSKELLKGPSILETRVGLLKTHADRRAAHITDEAYEVSLDDSAHVVAAMMIVGALVQSFDAPEFDADYYDQLDGAALEDAKRVFPVLAIDRLFKAMPIRKTAEDTSRRGPEGLKWVLDQLPGAIGWWASVDERGSRHG